MMKIAPLKILSAILFLLSCQAWATPATDTALSEYHALGAGPFNAQRGKILWTRQVETLPGEKKSCQTCHGTDLTVEGKHAKTLKVIDPMAPSINSKRLTDLKKIEKWFKRNCKDVWQRECTAQEKGDLLTFLLTQ